MYVKDVVNSIVIIVIDVADNLVFSHEIRYVTSSWDKFRPEISLSWKHDFEKLKIGVRGHNSMSFMCRNRRNWSIS